VILSNDLYFSFILYSSRVTYVRHGHIIPRHHSYTYMYIECHSCVTCHIHTTCQKYSCAVVSDLRWHREQPDRVSRQLPHRAPLPQVAPAQKAAVTHQGGDAAIRDESTELTAARRRLGHPSSRPARLASTVPT